MLGLNCANPLCQIAVGLDTSFTIWSMGEMCNYLIIWSVTDDQKGMMGKS